VTIQYAAVLIRLFPILGILFNSELPMSAGPQALCYSRSARRELGRAASEAQPGALGTLLIDSGGCGQDLDDLASWRPLDGRARLYRGCGAD
jgi:hypothetical protein